MRRMTFAAIGACLVASLGAAVLASDTFAAKQPKPAHVVASADFILVSQCLGGLFTRYGHIEVNAFDDDLVPVVNSWDRENDRVSFDITWSDGTTWTPDVLGVEINAEGDTAYFPWIQRGFGFTLHDGGNRGTELTGDTFGGIPMTVDWVYFNGLSACGDPYFFLTEGNITIKPAS
jgi:hypothetical protein